MATKNRIACIREIIEITERTDNMFTKHICLSLAEPKRNLTTNISVAIRSPKGEREIYNLGSFNIAAEPTDVRSVGKQHLFLSTGRSYQPVITIDRKTNVVSALYWNGSALYAKNIDRMTRERGRFILPYNSKGVILLDWFWDQDTMLLQTIEGTLIAFNPSTNQQRFLVSGGEEIAFPVEKPFATNHNDRIQFDYDGSYIQLEYSPN